MTQKYYVTTVASTAPTEIPRLIFAFADVDRNGEFTFSLFRPTPENKPGHEIDNTTYVDTISEASAYDMYKNRNAFSFGDGLLIAIGLLAAVIAAVRIKESMAFLRQIFIIPA